MACSARLSAGAAGGWARRGWCRGGRSAVASVPLRRRAELGITPDVAIPGPRSGLHLRTADKRWFVAVRLRCRNGGAQAPINVISTPTCGVLIRILVCARGMSRKEAFALLFVTGLLLAGRARAKTASVGNRAGASLCREAGPGIAAPRSPQPRPFALQSACLFDGGAQRIDDGAAECAFFQNLKAADGGSRRRAHLVL